MIITLVDVADSEKSNVKVALAAPSVTESPPDIETDTGGGGGGGSVVSEELEPPQAARMAAIQAADTGLVNPDMHTD